MTTGDDRHADRHRWTAESIVGRGMPGGKGFATAHSMTAYGPSGQVMPIGRLSRGLAHAEVRIITVAVTGSFTHCPICLSLNPHSDEHVPPASLGGTKVKTCDRCNHDLGSRVDVDLLNWWEDAYPVVRLEHESVQGARGVKRMLLRENANGEPVVLLDRPDLAVADAIAPGTNVKMHIQSHDRVRWRLGAIKSAYLGACLLLQDIPSTPDADAIRVDLLAARNAPRTSTLTESPYCASLNVYKTPGPAEPGEIALAVVQFEDEAPEICVSLARVLWVSWPFGTYYGRHTDGAEPMT